MPTKVLIVNDHPAVREGLAVRISARPDLEVCGEAADIPQALELARTSRARRGDCEHPVEERQRAGTGRPAQGPEQVDPRAGVVDVSRDIWRRGAMLGRGGGYINKECATGRIVEAIRRVREGKIYLVNDTAQHMLAVRRGRARQAGRRGSTFQPRIGGILRMIGDGLTASQIAQHSIAAVIPWRPTGGDQAQSSAEDGRGA